MFVCGGCGAELTVPVSEVALPVHTHQHPWHELLGVLMEPGTFAVDPGSFGPPWPPDRYVPPADLPGGPSGAVVIAPGDVRGTVFSEVAAEGECFGPDGRDGPNLACERCGRLVATRIDDCGHWQAVWLDPRAVRHVSGAVAPALTWDELRAQRPGVGPVEQLGYWSPLWSAAFAAAMARLLALSGGVPVAVPDGTLAELLRPALTAMLPGGAPGRTLTLAGPGLPAGDVDIALVPRHPQTGAVWSLPGAGDGVPLEWDVWAHLAHRPRRGPVALPAAERRDDPAPLLPDRPFHLDRHVFVAALGRLPEVREPWLRSVYDKARHPGSFAMVW
ncbi:hypothetical protein [Dactylosporangium sp. NPDC000521]|uniref:hypothetical protein n=1 Tax=Dactylosporangium sp. NPDC000521 TaxID=3363975 RepID=UPI0036A99DCB